MAPLVVKDKIIAGPAGGDFGVRGFISAFDPKTGKELWRFNTVPGPGEPGHETWAGDSWRRGGSAIWTTGSYDPELNLTYWGIGNPGPDFTGDDRKGDNLYSNSVVALDPDTGRLKWHFQFTPHDEYDFDATQVPVLADIEYQGRPRKVMLWANRNGFWYVLDRVTGEYLSGQPFTKVTWASGLDAKGRPQGVKPPTPEGIRLAPHFAGATNWYSPSYSPRTGLFYVPAWMDGSSVYARRPAEYVEGRAFLGAFPTGTALSINGTQVNRRRPDEGYGAVLALDPKTGTKKWEFKMTDVTDAGVLTTASDLLFSGGREGAFYALDARTGRVVVEGPRGRHRAGGADDLRGERPSIRGHRRWQLALRLRPPYTVGRGFSPAAPIRRRSSRLRVNSGGWFAYKWRDGVSRHRGGRPRPRESQSADHRLPALPRHSAHHPGGRHRPGG